MASEDETFSSSSPRFVKGFMVLLLAVGIGSQVSAWLTALTRLTFPGYIGAMLVATGVWQKPGVFNLEEMDPDPFMDALNRWGLPWQVEEHPVLVE